MNRGMIDIQIPETIQVFEGLVSILEHMQAQNGT